MFNPFKKKPFKIDDFAKLVITEAKKAGIGESLEYDPKRFVLTHGDQRTYLANLFDDYCQADGEHKKRILGNTLALLREKKQEVSFEEAKSKVVAAVREQALFSFATLGEMIFTASAYVHFLAGEASVLRLALGKPAAPDPFDGLFDGAD